MKNDLEKVENGFHAGRLEALDILERFSEIESDGEYKTGYYSGLIVALVDCMYSTLPTPMAENLLDLSVQRGIEEAAKFLQEK